MYLRTNRENIQMHLFQKLKVVSELTNSLIDMVQKCKKNFKEEIKNGDEVALFSRPVTRQNGEIVNAQLLKIGNQMIAYMDDESGKFGTLERRFENGKITYVWNENLDFSQRNAIKLALSVKSGREAPQLVPLDIRLMLDSSVTQGGR